MIKYNNLSTLFNTLSFPIEEYTIDTPDTVSTPFGAYISSSGNSVGADSTTYIRFINVRLVLINSDFDLYTQNQVEQILIDNELKFSKDYDYDETLRLHTTTYDFEVLQ